MKARSGIALAASLLTVGLGGGCTSVERGEAMVDDADTASLTIPEADKARMRSIYDDAVRVSGKAVTTKLVFVEGSDGLVCEQTGNTTTTIVSTNPPAYCPAPDAVVVTGAWAHHMSQGTMLGDGEERKWLAHQWMLYHELGHGEGLPGVSPGDALAREEAADHFAGCVMGKLVRQGLRDVDSIAGTAQIIKDELSAVGASAVGEERASAYLKGANDCASGAR